MSELEIPATRITREGVDPTLDTIADAGDGLYLARNDGNITLRITGTGSLFAVPAEAPEGWPSWAPTEVEVAGYAEAGPWPPAVYNRSDGSVRFTADAGLQVCAAGI